MRRFAQLSKEYVLADIVGTESSLRIDPTTDPIEIAVISQGTTVVTGDFAIATWETDATTVPPTYSARLLQDFSTLDPGVYDVYVRVSDNPERPVLFTGSIEVF